MNVLFTSMENVLGTLLEIPMSDFEPITNMNDC